MTSRSKIHVTYEADGAKGEHIPGHIFTKEVPGMAILMKDVVVDTEDDPSDDAAGSDATIDDDDDNDNTKGGAADGPAKKKVLKGRRKPTLPEHEQKEVAVRIQAGDPEAVALLDTMNGTALRGVVQNLGVAIKRTCTTPELLLQLKRAIDAGLSGPPLFNSPKSGCIFTNKSDTVAPEDTSRGGRAKPRCRHLPSSVCCQ